jgi:3-oxoacyl-[acyl-carrier-protein] synthase-3
MTTDLHTRIIGTGSYLAEGVLTNDDLSRIVDTSDEWIVERTGIRERRIAKKGIATSDMGAMAIKNALQMADIKPNQLDMIICGTVTPDYPMPATAPAIQEKLGITNHCPSFDLSAACAGFLYALSVADGMIRQGIARTVGVIGAETLSRFVDFEDRATCVLFGDGAGAAILTADTSGSGLLSSHLFTDGSRLDALKIPAGGSSKPITETLLRDREHLIKMNGREVFKYAIRYLEDASKQAFGASGVTPDEVTWVVPHQANIRILDAVSMRLGIPIERFILNLERFGNTSSASIPIALDEAVRNNRIKTGDLLLMIAMGAGLSWGSALVKW